MFFFHFLFTDYVENERNCFTFILENTNLIHNFIVNINSLKMLYSVCNQYSMRVVFMFSTYVVNIYTCQI